MKHFGNLRLGVVMLVCALLVTNHAYAFSGLGTGVFGDPYQITNCAELIEVDSEMGAEYLLMNDLDCSGDGANAMIEGTFTGVFNGGGNTITLNLAIDGGTVGLFQTLDNATVSDLRIAGSIEAVGPNVGGIAGIATDGATISLVVNEASVRGSGYVGGIIGLLSDSNLTNAYNTGAISSSSGAEIGGVVGEVTGGLISQVYNRGVIGRADESRYHVGGIAGWRNPTATIANSFNVGQVLTNQSTFFFGGLFGNDSDSLGGVLASGWVNNYFDVTRSTRSMCGYANDGSSILPTPAQCMAVNTNADQYSYFKDNHTNAPLDEWDFNTVWEMNENGYPSLQSIYNDGGPVDDGSDTPPADVTAPVLQSISPVNGAQDVALNANIILTFDEPVYFGTSGYITLATEEFLVVENIAITSGLVTGEGTTTITINPQFTFQENTEIYVIVGTTVFKDASDNYFTALSGEGASVFTTIDETAPVLTEVSGLSGTLSEGNPLIYRFRTNELCDVQATPPTSTLGRVEVLSEMVVLNNDIGITLQGTEPGGTYSFTISCQDEAGNVSNSLAVGPFTVYQTPAQSSGRSSSFNVVSASANQTCSTDQVLSQNLKAPARNGMYHPYTKGVVTQANILQTHLNRLGFNAGPVDGILGKLSDAAIKRMQTYLGTKADGYVGPLTRALINQSCGAAGLTKTR